MDRYNYRKIILLFLCILVMFGCSKKKNTINYNINDTGINYEGLEIGDDGIPLKNQIKINNHVFKIEADNPTLEIKKSDKYEIIFTADLLDQTEHHIIKTNEFIPFEVLTMKYENKEKRTGTEAYILKADIKTDLKQFEILNLTEEAFVKDVKTGEYRLKDNIRDYEIKEKIIIKIIDWWFK